MQQQHTEDLQKQLLLQSKKYVQHIFRGEKSLQGKLLAYKGVRSKFLGGGRGGGWGGG